MSDFGDDYLWPLRLIVIVALLYIAVNDSAGLIGFVGSVVSLMDGGLSAFTVPTGIQIIKMTAWMMAKIAVSAALLSPVVIFAKWLVNIDA